ncbi:NADAR family protein [Marinilabiliaceae bacterium JC017]|nr:NADAR family protein [Marinilabiliaceae bacterium JC017]
MLKDMKYNKEKTIQDFRSGKKQKFLFFWGHQKQRNGEVGQSCLSQWWSTEFTIDGVKYFSAEHFMMAEKARLFKDSINLERIINSSSPGQAKQYGREVIGFKEEIWMANRYDIVKKGNIEKFKQNKDLKAFLLSTKNRILVEASPVDTIWGIGLTKESEHCKNPLKWRGMNLLGFALMEVRDEINKEK